MGAWGYGSFDNDTALDFIPELINLKPIKRLVNKKSLETWEYDEVRVAAEILIHLHKINNLWVDYDIILGLTDKLNIIINDKEWVDDWDNELAAKAMIRQLKGFVKKLEKLEGY